MKNEVSRNQVLDIIRIIAVCFVIFIHIRFAGSLGKVMECLARFAVPFFFALSGFYAFEADALSIKKRMFRILRFLLIFSAVYLIWGMISCGNGYNADAWDYLAQRFSPEALSRWIFLDFNPFAEHLWFLSALFFSYLIFWLYLRIRKEKSSYLFFYCFGAFALLAHVILGTFFQAAGTVLNYVIYRNTLLFALPMFSMGLFLHDYQALIIRKFRLNAKKVILLTVICLALSVFQRFGIGKTELPLGMIPAVALVLVYVTSLSKPPETNSRRGRICLIFGKAVLFIYALHPLYDSILRFFESRSPFIAGIISSEAYPLVILALSAVLGIIISLIYIKCGKITRTGIYN